MAIKAIPVGAVKEYTSRYDSEEFKTVFTLKALDAVTFMELADRASTSGPTRLNLEVVRNGLVDCTGLFDEVGNPVEFKKEEIVTFYGKKEVASWDFLKYIPPNVINELAEEIIKTSQLSEEARKNLD